MLHYFHSCAIWSLQFLTIKPTSFFTFFRKGPATNSISHLKGNLSKEKFSSHTNLDQVSWRRKLTPSVGCFCFGTTNYLIRMVVINLPPASFTIGMLQCSIDWKWMWVEFNVLHSKCKFPKGKTNTDTYHIYVVLGFTV